MLRARVTGKQLVMVGKRGWWPGGKSVNDCITAGSDKFGQQTMHQVRGKRGYNNQPSTRASEAW
jgi:hypothetical protein